MKLAISIGNNKDGKYLIGLDCDINKEIKKFVKENVPRGSLHGHLEITIGEVKRVMYDENGKLEVK